MDSVQKGDKRICSGCEEVKWSWLFPYKGRPECYLCYEKVTGKTLHSFRQQIGRQAKTTSNSSQYKCHNCDSVTSTWSGRCVSCGQWNTQTKVSAEGQPKIKKEKFTQEVSREYILEYLKYRSVSNLPIKIYYKDDKAFRTFYSYSFDNTYLRVAGTKGYDYKYIIDRIRNVEL